MPSSLANSRTGTPDQLSALDINNRHLLISELLISGLHCTSIRGFNEFMIVKKVLTNDRSKLRPSINTYPARHRQDQTRYYSRSHAQSRAADRIPAVTSYNAMRSEVSRLQSNKLLFYNEINKNA